MVTGVADDIATKKTVQIEDENLSNITDQKRVEEAYNQNNATNSEKVTVTNISGTSDPRGNTNQLTVHSSNKTISNVGRGGDFRVIIGSSNGTSESDKFVREKSKDVASDRDRFVAENSKDVASDSDRFVAENSKDVASDRDRFVAENSKDVASDRDRFVAENCVEVVNLLAPDGGWGWRVLAGCLYLAMMMSSISLCFSLLFGPKLKSMNVSATTISWIFNGYLLLFQTTITVAGPLIRKVGYRCVALPSVVVTGVCFTLLAWVSSPAMFVFVFSIVIGCSAGFSYYVAVLILPAYFDKRRGLAIGLTSTSISVGQIIMPQVIKVLQETQGYFGSTLIYSGLILNCCVAATLFQPVERHQRREPSKCSSEVERKLTKLEQVKKSEIKDLIVTASTDSLSVANYIEQQKMKENGEITTKNKSFFREIIAAIGKNLVESIRSMKSLKVLICGIGIGLYSTGYINFLMMIPFVVIEAGYGYEVASYCVTTVAITNTITRLMISATSDRIWCNVTVSFMVGPLISAGFCLLFMASASNLWMTYASLAGYGIGLGLTVSVRDIVLINTVGLDRYVPSLGACSVIKGILFLTAGPAFGYLRDSSTSYWWSMAVSALMQVTQPVLWLLLMPLANRIDSTKSTE